MNRMEVRAGGSERNEINGLSGQTLHRPPIDLYKEFAASATLTGPYPATSADASLPAPPRPENITAVALAIVARGVPIFPVREDKKPACRGGFHSASADPAKVRRLFRIPSTRLIGMPTGEASGFDILDVDPRHNGHLWLMAHAERLPRTQVHRTRGGGIHLIFRHHPGIRNSASRIAPGIDVRGCGGYAVIPPSQGYSILLRAEVAFWPEWLLTPDLALQPPPEPKLVSVEPPVAISDARVAGYVRSLLRNVSNAKDGEKREKLIKNGRALGGILEYTGMSQAQAAQALYDALPDSIEDKDAAKDTAAWAVAQGADKPYPLEDRDRGGRR